MSALIRATLYIVVLFLPGMAKAPVVYAQEAEVTDRDRAVHLLQRATYGPRPENIEEVLSLGIAPESAHMPGHKDTQGERS